MSKFGDSFGAWLRQLSGRATSFLDPSRSATTPFGFLGNLFGSAFGKYFGTNLTGAEREANAFTAQQNQEAMAFEERMADKQMAFQADQAATQWQRGVADMQSAGLNPALAYGQGGASAMSGSSGAGHAGVSVVPGAGSLSDLIQLATLGPTIENIKSQARNTRAEARLKEIDSKTRGSINEGSIAKLAAEISKLNADASLSRFQRSVLGPLEKAIKEHEETSKSVQALYDAWRKEYYDATGHWPQDHAESFFFNFLEGTILDSAKSSAGIPFFEGESDRFGVRGF